MGNANVSNELIFETLKSMQGQLKSLNQDVISLQRTVVDGFSALKSHIMTHHGDQFSLETRMATLENWMIRLRREMEITDSLP
jgi:hypothetical protein